MNDQKRADGERIGVIGFGNLGKRLVAQLLYAGYEVYVFDVQQPARLLFDQAVDPTIEVDLIDNRFLHFADMQEILQRCTTIHWAAPSANLELPPLSSTHIAVLHDSVMANSAEAVRSRPEDSDRFVAVHCLMNDARRVLIATDYDESETVAVHFETMDLSPRYTTTKAHDTLMARTQGAFALLIEAGMREELDAGYDAGNLTPSAIELRAAVKNREARWTRQTLRSILKNPELTIFAEELARVATRNVQENSDD